MSSGNGIFQNIYRKYAPIFNSKAYTPLATNESERNNWMVNRKNSIDASSVLSEESRSSEAGSSGSVVLGDEPKPYYDDFDDEEGRLDFEHLSNFTAEPKKKEDSETWYLTVLAAVLVYHKEDAVGDLWAYLLKLQTQDDGERQLGIIAKRLRDACLKCAVFAGFPRAMGALSSLQRAIEQRRPESRDSQKSNEPQTQSTEDGPNREARGKQLFKSIHGKDDDDQAEVDQDIQECLDTKWGEDVSHLIISNVYGEILLGTKVLTELETALLAFASCLADKMPTQAACYFRGCKKLGATSSELLTTVSLVREVAAELGLECPSFELPVEREEQEESR